MVVETLNVLVYHFLDCSLNNIWFEVMAVNHVSDESNLSLKGDTEVVAIFFLPSFFVSQVVVFRWGKVNCPTL